MPIKKEYDKDFFKRWSHDMAYVLGFLYADGNILVSQKGGYYTSLYSADKILVQKMRKALSSSHHISERVSPTGVHYRMQIGSKEWFADLLALGMTAAKSQRLVFPAMPSKYFGDFVRGYFDGDGNVWVGVMHKERKTTTLVIFAAFTSGSIDFLRVLLDELSLRGIQGGSVHVLKGGNYGRLNFSTRDALKLYEIMYNGPHELYLERKKSVFDRFMKERSNGGTYSLRGSPAAFNPEGC